MGKLSELYLAHLTAWKNNDTETALTYMADDIVWYPNRAMRPVVGKPAVREFMAKFGRGMTDKAFSQSLMIEQGDILFVEGVESYTKAGRRIDTQYAGIVEWRDGKAVAWRDYFDLKTLEAQLAG